MLSIPYTCNSKMNGMKLNSYKEVIVICVLLLVIAIIFTTMAYSMKEGKSENITNNTEIKVLESGETYEYVMFKGHTYYRFKDNNDMEHNPDCEVCKNSRRN